MKPLKLASITALALAALTSTGAAGSYTPPAVSPPIMPPASMAHDWTGWYGDVYAGHWASGLPDNYLGANIGYLTGSSTFLYGGELGFLYDPSLTYSQVTIDARVAAPVSDSAMVFANLGLGRDDNTDTFAEYSIGGQYAFSDSTYMRGEFIGQSVVSGGFVNTTSLRLGVGLEF